MLAAKTLDNHDRFAHLRELLRSAKHTVKMRKGTFLFQEGMDAAELYLILSGKVQISKIGADGKEMCFRICGPGEIIGELTLFTAEPRYLLTAKVIEDGEVAAIKKDDLEQQLLTNPALAYEYMQWVSTHGGRKQNFAI